MKRLQTFLVCLFVVMAMSLRAQEVTITLAPGWNWIGYPYPESVDLETAFGDFEPMPGDMIKSLSDFSNYEEEDGWFGDVESMEPGWGYKYYSTRTETATVVVGVPTLSSNVTVTTSEPTDITAFSMVCGGEVTNTGNCSIIVHGLCWGTEPNPTVACLHTGGDFGIGSFSYLIDGLEMNTAYYVRAYALTEKGMAYGNEMTITTVTYHPYVDLGLPSGILWATCNVGADNPEDYGDYFAWGETQPKEVYSWSTYQYCNGNEFTLTKYCNVADYGYDGFTDNLTALLPEDDAPSANWGGEWSIPTKEEWQELCDNTTRTWTTQNGVNGWLFTASNGNSLFLPAAGCRFSNTLYLAGSCGTYWSDTLYTDNPGNARHFYCTSDNYYVDHGSRYYGRSVRAVRSGQSVQSHTISVSASPSDGGSVSGGGTYRQGQSCMVTATANSGYVFTNWMENSEVVSTDDTYSFTVTGNRNLVANFAVSGDDHEYVDLGLPSGLLWATCNVGADTPEAYGDYFAWGETQPKDVYSWSAYQYSNGGNWDNPNLIKYCNNSSYGYNGFTDNLTTVLPEDDAATANWGNDWHMPTQAEWQELLDNTTVTVTQQNGVNGRLFTASNGNSLFLPAAGYRYSSGLNYAGSNGYYWSSSLYTDDPISAWTLYFNSGNYGMSGHGRYCGRSVRAVRSESQNSSYVINVTTIPMEGGTVDGGGNYQEGQTCTVTATANAGYVFTNWMENSEVVSTDATYTFTVQDDRTLVAIFTASSVDEHAYVDLGLPSGTLWATCNVGASTPEAFGNYFAWGETQPKYDAYDYYDWSAYQYSNGGNWDNPNLIKYCNNSSYGYNGFTDNLTTLLPEDDAATANWGNDWRMPTQAEWQELLDNTTVTITWQNDKTGCLFTASNGNSLFLPGAEYLPGPDCPPPGNRFVEEGFLYYWSSSLNTDYPSCAWNLYINTRYDNCHDVVEYCGRYYGYSVRAVRSGQNVQSYTISVLSSPNNGGSVSGGGTYGQGQSCTVTAAANSGYVFTNWTENDEVVSSDATCSFTVIGNRNLVANFTALGNEGHAYVDLGLPSGILWATCNVGASVPEDYGDYFAWGETRPKNDYSWSTYQYCNGSYNTLTKYCNDASYGYNGFTDTLTVLLLEDDAAAANWGSGWRMPTFEEWQELYTHTTMAWVTTQNGVKGKLFTASNGNSLFLPASNYGDSGSYLSSSLYTVDPCCHWFFFIGPNDNNDMREGLRRAGTSVRAVRYGQNVQSCTIGVSVSPSNGGIVLGGGIYGQGQCCTVSAAANYGYHFTNWMENGEVVSTDESYTFIVQDDRTLVANFIGWSSEEHACVDLGLPSGTLWATCNVGANTPEDYGDYFAWGEIQPKEDYSWSSYQYSDGSYNTLTKYCNNASYGYSGFTDNLTTLLPEDDATSSNWGGEWRIPTKEEWLELCSNTTITTLYQNNVAGCRFTASNGNSIFLPLAGLCTENSSLPSPGQLGTYWSSTLATGNPSDAWSIALGADSYSPTDCGRNAGLSLRPVRSGQN